MAWSKVKKPFDKSLKWWYHKILCEIGWSIQGSGKMYYKHLDKLCSHGWLYGEQIKKNNIK